MGRASDEVIAGLDRGILRQGVADPMEAHALAALSEAAEGLTLGERRPGHAGFAERYKAKFEAKAE